MKTKVEFRVHKYKHDPSLSSYGEEASSKLGIDTDRVFKTLVVAIGDKDFAVAVLPVSKKLDVKLYAKAVGVKKVVMAEKNVVEKITGYVLGGVSPIGQNKHLTTLIDESAKNFDTIFVSAGRRGLEIELSPKDLCSLTSGSFMDIGK